MINPEEIFSIVRIILFGIIVLVAFVYSIPIVFLHRFHHRNNILTLNICIATTLCCLYWFVFYIRLRLDLLGTYRFMLNSCIFVFIVPTILTVQIPFSFVTVSIHRLCCIQYHNKDLFKTKKWIVICILAQWILGVIFILPILSEINLQYCQTSRWIETYKMIFIIIIPFVIALFANIVIFINVRSSTRRVRPGPSSVIENHSHVIRPRKISGRDLHLLRHMVIMLAIFLGGWAPLYVLLAIENQFVINPVLMACFTIWCELALLCDIIDLYLYNHEVRNYLKTSILRRFQWF